LNVLVISNNPERASFRQRIEIYLDNLRDNGINCEIALLPDGWLARRKLFKSSGDFDVVFLHKKRMNPLDAFVLRRSARKIIYDFDDAVMYSDQHSDTPDPKRLRDFQRTVNLADLIIAGNNYLAEHAKKFNHNVKILPTGLDVSQYNLKINPSNDGIIRLVWIGSKATLPYLREIKPALEEIGSILHNVVLRIISDEFFEMQNMKVEKYAWSSQTQIRDLAECDIGLAPLPNNRFTKGKCGFKILQYFSAAMPVVASPVGTNSDYAQENVTGFLAETSDQWIEKISMFVKNPKLRKTMGQNGRQFARQFDVSVIGKRLCEIIRTCASA
jgi:glycosyltransferase involved in cell wall biosynthesis